MTARPTDLRRALPEAMTHGPGCDGAEYRQRMTSMEHTEPKPRLSDLAQEQILYRIRTGELPVGSRLPSEPELAQQMGISRGILREALNSLQTRGYITRTPRGGSHIARPEASALSEGLMNGLLAASLADLIDYREGLETYAAILAVSRATDEELAGLRALAQFETEHSVNDSRDFHYRLAELSRVSLFTQYIDFYFERLPELTQELPLKGLPPQVGQDMERILKALENRNSHTLHTAMVKQFRHSRQYYKII